MRAGASGEAKDGAEIAGAEKSVTAGAAEPWSVGTTRTWAAAGKARNSASNVRKIFMRLFYRVPGAPLWVLCPSGRGVLRPAAASVNSCRHRGSTWRDFEGNRVIGTRAELLRGREMGAKLFECGGFHAECELEIPAS